MRKYYHKKKIKISSSFHNTILSILLYCKVENRKMIKFSNNNFIP